MSKKLLVAIAPVIALAGCTTADSGTIATSSSATQPTQSLAASVTSLSPEEVRQGYIKNATLAQYYRWYQFYENDASALDNAIDILDPNVTVKSGLGEATGHDAYRRRVLQIPKAWDNAHDVKDVNITVKPDGTIGLVATIDYLNKGLLPDDAVRTANLTYTTTLVKSDELLPKFTNIAIAQNSDGTTDTFVDAYGENRVKSLLHYWLALIENPERNPEPFRELLANGYNLNFSSGMIDDFDKFKAWYNGPASSISASTHIVKSLKTENIGPNRYSVEAELDWNGILPNGDEMVGRTVHKWTVVDNPAERFARIKTIDVDLTIPFQPKP